MIRLFTLLLFASLAHGVGAQVLDERFGVALRLQTNLYWGDRSPKHLSLLDRAIGQSGLGGGLEFSFAPFPWLDNVLQVDRGTYPSILNSPRGLPIVNKSISSDARVRWSVSSRYRLPPIDIPFGPIPSLTPYVHAGVSVVRGLINGQHHTGFGPSYGYGLEMPILTSRVATFWEVTHFLSHPNRAIDLAGGDHWDPDDLFTIGAGVRYRFARPVPASRLVTLTAPSVLEAGTPGLFIASVEPGHDPISVEWVFSDGGRESGETVYHAFAAPGDYEATASVRNPTGTRTTSVRIQVVAPDLPVEVSAVVTVPLRPRTGETIQFKPVIRGAKYSCAWDFGDGNRSDACETEHAYQASGLFTYRLSVSSPGFSVTLHRDLDVESDRCVAVGRLHTVHFHSNSSELVSEMRDLLRENLELITSCPGRKILVTGAASREEMDAPRLAGQRALVVFQFYRLMGVPETRFVEPFDSAIQSATRMTWEDRYVRTELK